MSLPKNYHPISLISILGEIYEKIIAAKVVSIFDRDHLSSRQFGFRTGRSASALLLHLTTSRHQIPGKGKETLAVALGTSGAFDRHCPWGIEGNLQMLIEYYIQGRSLCVATLLRITRSVPVIPREGWSFAQFYRMFISVALYISSQKRLLTPMIVP